MSQSALPDTPPFSGNLDQHEALNTRSAWGPRCVCVGVQDDLVVLHVDSF